MTAPAASRVFDNPAMGRLLRSHLRPRRLIVMSALHAAILLLAVCAANLLNAWADFRAEIDAGRIGFVRLLFGVLILTECLWVSLYVPIRCGMVLYEDRREGCLGELAAFGLSPLRLCAGQVCVVMAGVGRQLLCALPFLSLCVTNFFRN